MAWSVTRAMFVCVRVYVMLLDSFVLVRPATTEFIGVLAHKNTSLQWYANPNILTCRPLTLYAELLADSRTSVLSVFCLTAARNRTTNLTHVMWALNHNTSRRTIFAVTDLSTHWRRPFYCYLTSQWSAGKRILLVPMSGSPNQRWRRKQIIYWGIEQCPK